MTQAKNFSSSGELYLQHYIKHPTDMASSDKIRSKSRLICGSPAKLDSGVDAMHGCFTEGGDSILGVFSWELLNESHDLSGCTCAC